MLSLRDGWFLEDGVALFVVWLLLGLCEAEASGDWSNFSKSSAEMPISRPERLFVFSAFVVFDI